MSCHWYSCKWDVKDDFKKSQFVQWGKLCAHNNIEKRWVERENWDYTEGDKIQIVAEAFHQPVFLNNQVAE